MIMTADTIFLNHPGSWFQHPDALFIPPGSKNGRMPHSVFRLEIIGMKNRIVGDMTIIAYRLFTVRGMTPGCILGAHDVTIDARFRVIRNIGPRPGHIKSVSTTPSYPP